MTAPAGKRLDQAWSERLKGEGVSRARVQEWIRAGRALVDGRPATKANVRLAGGEFLVLNAEPPRPGLAPEDGPLPILYLDDHLAVADKPAGLTVHPAPSQPEGTLVHRLVRLFPELAALDPQRPGVVHRIDKDTSGLLVLARTEAARLALAEDFAARRVDKRYLAIVHGRPKTDEGDIDLPLGRHPTVKTKMAVLAKGGREARSRWTVLWSAPSNAFSLLAVKIFTGRTHQIRVHLSHLGHPLVGDRTYGAAAQAALAKGDPLAGRLAARQMLHAWTLAFRHPAEPTRRLAFKSVPPKDFRRLPLALARRLQRVVLIGPAAGGKSALLSLFAEAGVPVFSADRAVAELYAPGQPGWHLLRARYGGRFAPDDRQGVDKRALLAAMLREPGLRQEIVDMIHPLVHSLLEDFWQAHGRARLAVAEIPLFLEAGWRAGGADADALVGVERPAQARLACLDERGWSAEALAAVDGWQWPWPEKAKRCDILVDNSGPPEALRARAAEALAALRRMRRQAVRRLWDELHALWN